MEIGRISPLRLFGVRRRVLAAIVFMVLVVLAAVGVAAQSPDGAAVKNIIYMIGDGMGFHQIETARLVKGAPLTMDGLPVKHQAVNPSANATITDSAAAGTAHATGYRTNNGMVAISPDGQELTSILRLAKAAGKATGVVVTDVVYGATPGSYLANVNSRSEQDTILEQTLFRTQPDVLLGGGISVFNAIGGAARLAETPYTLVSNRDELLEWRANGDGSLLGLFTTGSMTYEVDRPATVPHIAEMVQVALDVLSQADDGFFLMIEGSRIDHAGHANDLRRSIHETIAFDEAIAVVLEFAAERGDTLVVVTADHETGGLTQGEATASPLVMSQGASTIAAQIRSELTQNPGADVAAVFERLAGISDLESHIEPGTLDDLILVVLNKHSFYYTKTDHSAAPVPVFAFGPGAERFAEVEHITDMGRTAMDLLGVWTGGDL